MKTRIYQILILAFVLCIPASLWADKPITAEQLPAQAKQFIEEYFPNKEIAYAKVDKELFETSYEVVLTSSDKIDFNRKGEWTSIDCNHSVVPNAIIPTPIQKYLTKHHPNLNVIEIERDRKGYEVSIQKGFELHFDLDGNFVMLD